MKEQLKHYCKSILHLIDRLERTQEKGDINEIEIGISNYIDLIK